jgi:hypothetical protein
MVICDVVFVEPCWVKVYQTYAGLLISWQHFVLSSKVVLELSSDTLRVGVKEISKKRQLLLRSHKYLVRKVRERTNKTEV